MKWIRSQSFYMAVMERRQVLSEISVKLKTSRSFYQNGLVKGKIHYHLMWAG